MSYLLNACFLFVLVIAILSNSSKTSALECFVGDCSAEYCLVGFGSYVANCTDEEPVCMKFVSVQARSSRESPGTRNVKLERRCGPRSAIRSSLTGKIMADKHFCEDLSIKGTFGAEQPGTRCWCWDSDRCNSSGSLAEPFHVVILKAISALVASQYLVLYQTIYV